MARNGSWADALEILAREPVTDVIVIAFLEPPPKRSLHVMFHEVYLELGSGYLQLASVHNNGGLRARYLDAIDLDAYRDEFPHDEVLPVSLGSQYLGEVSRVDCVEVTYVTNDESDLDSGVVRAAELVFSNHQRAYFDPMHSFGVRIGNAGDWMREYETQPWRWERHTWARP